MSGQLISSSSPVTPLDEIENAGEQNIDPGGKVTKQDDDQQEIGIVQPVIRGEYSSRSGSTSQETVVGVVTTTRTTRTKSTEQTSATKEGEHRTGKMGTTEAQIETIPLPSSSSAATTTTSSDKRSKFKLLRQSASIFAEAFEQPSSLILRRGRSREKKPATGRKLLDRLHKSSSEPSSTPSSLGSRSIDDAIDQQIHKSPELTRTAAKIPHDENAVASESRMRTTSGGSKTSTDAAAVVVCDNTNTLPPILEEKRSQAAKVNHEDEEEISNMLGLHVHNLDRKIKSSHLISHPLVKVHVMDIRTGKYLAKKHQSRAVVSYYENSPSRSKGIPYIQPLMTQSCDLVQYIRYPRAAIWEELLIYNEDYEYFLSNNVIFLFEILDFVSFDSLGCKESDARLMRKKKEICWWNRIAWAFLRVIGSDGRVNAGKKVRLQLFQPISAKCNSTNCTPTKKLYTPSPNTTTTSATVHSSNDAQSLTNSCTTDIFSWWLDGNKQQFPGSLFVTMKSIPYSQSKFCTKSCLRSLMPFQPEEGRNVAEFLEREKLRNKSKKTKRKMRKKREQEQAVDNGKNVNNNVMKKKPKNKSSATRHGDAAVDNGITTTTTGSGTSDEEEERRDSGSDSSCSGSGENESDDDEESSETVKNETNGGGVAGQTADGIGYEPLGHESSEDHDIYKIPRIRFKELSAGNNRSCYSIKFSNNGKRIACGASVFAAYLSAEKRSSVFMFEIPSGSFHRRVNGFHHGTIYDIDWSFDDQFLMSASNDCTVQIWSTVKEKLPSVVLPHPCFIYSCKFCPMHEYQYLIFTGALDGIIRIWSIRRCFDPVSVTNKDPELLRELDPMQGQVLCLAFKTLNPAAPAATASVRTTTTVHSPEIHTTSTSSSAPSTIMNNSISTTTAAAAGAAGKLTQRSSFKSRGSPVHRSSAIIPVKINLILFASGSNGTITSWRHTHDHAMVIMDPANWMPTGKIKVPELRNVPISSIEISPRGSRMLLCCRDGLLRMIDYDLESVIQEYPGSVNFSHLIRGSLSPCGKFVFNGSEDGFAYVWSTETGEQMHVYNSLPFKGPVTCVTFHPYENVVAICGLGGRTVSVVCFTTHQQEDDNDDDDDPLSDNLSSTPPTTRSGSQALISSTSVMMHHNRNHHPPAGMTAKATTAIAKMTQATRRKLLQKSMTVDSHHSAATPVTGDHRSPGMGVKGVTADSTGSSISSSSRKQAGKQQNRKQSSPSSRKFDPHPDTKTSSTPSVTTPLMGTTTASTSVPPSRMRRAMKRLEIALLMKSLDRS